MIVLFAYLRVVGRLFAGLTRDRTGDVRCPKHCGTLMLPTRKFPSVSHARKTCRENRCDLAYFVIDSHMT